MRSLVIIGAGVAVSCIIVGSIAAIRRDDPASPPITVPVRQAQPAPPGPPAKLPPSAEALAPLTLTVSTRWQHAGRPTRMARQTILRTVDRTLVTVEGTDAEWLFVRNPVDRRRVSAYLIEHGEKRILRYDESDLRSGQGLRGWLDVVTLRFDPRALDGLRPTGNTERFAGHEFLQYVADTRPENGVVEVWWNAKDLLARRLTTKEGEAQTTSILETVDAGVEQSRLVMPPERFPDYPVADVSDVRERTQH